MHRMVERAATAPDGYPVHGWVTTPPGPGPHPVLLTIHGGPFGQYGWTLFDEAQAYVSAGYAVVQCNPRGSSGYGEAHGRAIKGSFGELAADDVLALLDAALDRSGAGRRPGRRHGRLVRRVPDHAADRPHDRFTPRSASGPSSTRSASSGRQTSGGSSPTSTWAPTRTAGRAERDDAATEITTPTLVIHSEEDWRCPLEQGARLYVELKRRGVPSELLLFPGEGHELSRSGRPRHRLARLEHMLRWWARWLPTTGTGGRRRAGGGRPGNRADEPPTAEPLTVRATRVD